MKNNSTPKCNHECDLINWDTGNYQCSNCGALIRKYDWLNEKLKNNSTPKEGWEERFNKLVKEFKDNTVWITHLIFKDFIQEEIAKARQEERQEIAEWAKRYDKRNDGINKSDLIKKLEEE